MLLPIVPIGIPGTLRIIGELDISNVEEAQARFERELLAGRQLALDTSELAFMDSQVSSDSPKTPSALEGNGYHRGCSSRAPIHLFSNARRSRRLPPGDRLPPWR